LWTITPDASIIKTKPTYRQEVIAMFGRFGIWEIALILVIILIIFGVGKLPQVGGALGKGIRAFKKGQTGEEEDAEEEEVAAAPRKTTRKKAVKS
jgi:sec-independent protein translocase protein TatA